MQDFPFRELVTTCPTCLNDNTIVSEMLPTSLDVTCSQCGEMIGKVSDLRDAFIPLQGPPIRFVDD